MSSTDEIQIRTVAEQAARTAGSFIRLMALDNLKVFKAGEISKPGKFLSVFDKEAERLIRNTIKMHFPDSDVFTDADIDKRFSSSEFSKITWFVDPLDGSKAFLKGQFAFVCLSLAAWDPQGVVTGVIFNPFTDMLYSATRTSECFLNSQILPKPKPTARKNARLLVDYVKDTPEIIKRALMIAESHLGRILRFDGSIAQHLALVAKGTLDGAIIWGTGTKGAYWDLAAAILLLQRQGILITNLNGSPVTPSSKNFDQLLVAQPDLHGELLTWIAEIQDLNTKAE